ncbi:MAG: nucleotidyltransferase family protein [Calditrichaeota bacterium]|nr:MAG: nucleotidyltransferase family protein [Calditrichota bacterium]
MMQGTRELNISCVLLAAGSSKRFGASNKLLAKTGSVTVIAKTCRLLQQFSFQEFVIVLGYEHEKLRAQLSPDAHTIVNHHYYKGLASSLRCGITSLSKSCDGILIHLADIPFVKRNTIQTLLDNFQLEQGAKICLPVYNNKQGHPVIFPVYFKNELTTLSGDTGARDLIRTYSEKVMKIEVTDKNITIDIDRKSDLNQKMEGTQE